MTHDPRFVAQISGETIFVYDPWNGTRNASPTQLIFFLANKAGRPYRRTIRPTQPDPNP